MTYCTLAQLTDRYGAQDLIDLTDREVPASGEIDVEVVNRALADTDALINGYLLERYSLPLEAVPPLLVDVALAIAIYKLHHHVAPERIEKDYRDALKSLAAMSSGAIRLSVEGIEPGGTDAGKVRTNDPERPFSTSSMKGFI